MIRFFSEVHICCYYYNELKEDNNGIVRSLQTSEIRGEVDRFIENYYLTYLLWFAGIPIELHFTFLYFADTIFFT